MVVELGARAEGDIKALCDLARPDIGVVTTVGVAHTEAFRVAGGGGSGQR